MRLTCSSNILSQENYHRVMSIALRFPCTGYGPSTSLGDYLAHLRPLCLLSLCLCQWPYGLGFVHSAYHHSCLFRPIALSSPSWELLPSWPFSGHASLSTASEYGLTAVCPSSLPSHRVSDYLAAYRLLKLRPLTLDLILSNTRTLLHGHLPRIWHSSVVNNFLAHVSTLGPYSLLPFWHITTSLPQKDSCLNRLCILWVFNSITLLSLGLSPYYHNVYVPSRLTYWLRHVHFLPPLKTRFAYITTLTFNIDATAIRLASHKQLDYCSLKFCFTHIQM